MAISYEKTLERLGERIEQLRKERDLSQELVASKAGISHAYYWSIIKNGRNASLRTLYKLAKALDVTLAELFNF